MRVVIDTNVIVSGILNPHGSPGRIVNALLSEVITALYDDRVLEEYREVLLRPTFGFSSSNVETVLDFVESAGEYVSAKPLSLILPDRNDLPFLEVATSGGADALITGNMKHFTPRRGQHSVLVIAPSDFLRRYGE